MNAEINRGRGIYCSRPCYFLDKNKQVAIGCKVCGTEVFKTASQLKSGGKYCSTRCYGADKRVVSVKKCFVCKTEFRSRGDFCSKACCSDSRSLKYRSAELGIGHSPRLYRIWSVMKSRCNNPQSTGYCYWGGRGIFVCEEWVNDYFVFAKWALANGYQDNLTIDRIDVDGNYEAKNCRWATRKVQNRNKRITKIDEQDVGLIRYLRSRGFLVPKIAKAFGISEQMTYRISKHKAWN